MSCETRQRRVVIASYNIHGSVGLDREHDPPRIAEVIKSLEADIVGLQEVRRGLFEEGHLLELLRAEQPAWHLIEGPTIVDDWEHYGNALLSRYPLTVIRRQDISVPGREPRGAVAAAVRIADKSALLVVNSHFGLRRRERRFQARQILSLCEGFETKWPGNPLCVMGDFNEWLVGSSPLRILRREFGSFPAPRSYPAKWPVFALDRIYMKPANCLQSIESIQSYLARVASDHLPIRAVIQVKA